MLGGYPDNRALSPGCSFQANTPVPDLRPKTVYIAPPSPITTEWLGHLIHAARSTNCTLGQHALSRCEATAFALITLLLGHDVMRDGLDDASISATMDDPSRVFRSVERISLLPDNIPALAKAAASQCTMLRKSGMRLRGANPLTAAFAPPRADAVPRLLRCVHADTGRAFGIAENHADTALALLVYAEFFAFLSIHPLPDGNGRTARWLYAARLWNAHLLDASLLLALPLSFARQGARFHLAAQLARSGQFADLFCNWQDAVDQARSYASDLVEALCKACEARDLDATRTALDNMRRLMHAIMA